MSQSITQAIGLVRQVLEDKRRRDRFLVRDASGDYRTVENPSDDQAFVEIPLGDSLLSEEVADSWALSLITALDKQIDGDQPER